MKKTFLGVAFLALVLIFSGCQNSPEVKFNYEPVTLKVAAVPSLKDPLEELKTLYQRENKNVTITYDFKKSNELTQSILKNNTYDLIILSSKKDMNQLAGQQLIDPDTESTLATNSLVLIAPEDSDITSVSDLATWQVSTVAIGDPDTTSSGHYAVDTLTRMGLYSDLEYKITEAKNVKELLDTVKDDDAQAGIVFYSDVYNDDSVKVAYSFPKDNADTVVYPMAISAVTEHIDAAKNLDDYLKSAAAKEVLARYGFETSSSDTTTPEAVANSTSSEGETAATQEE